MSVRFEDDLIRLDGDCHVEDAETLVALIQGEPGRAVDLSQCRHLHSAVVQALLALRPPLIGAGADEKLEAWAFARLRAR